MVYMVRGEVHFWTFNKKVSPKGKMDGRHVKTVALLIHMQNCNTFAWTTCRYTYAKRYIYKTAPPPRIRYYCSEHIFRITTSDKMHENRQTRWQTALDENISANPWHLLELFHHTTRNNSNLYMNTKYSIPLPSNMAAMLAKNLSWSHYTEV